MSANTVTEYKKQLLNTKLTVVLAVAYQLSVGS